MSAYSVFGSKSVIQGSKAYKSASLGVVMARKVSNAFPNLVQMNNNNHHRYLPCSLHSPQIGRSGPNSRPSLSWPCNGLSHSLQIEKSVTSPVLSQTSQSRRYLCSLPVLSSHSVSTCPRPPQ